MKSDMWKPFKAFLSITCALCTLILLNVRIFHLMRITAIVIFILYETIPDISPLLTGRSISLCFRPYQFGETPLHLQLTLALCQTLTPLQ